MGQDIQNVEVCDRHATNTDTLMYKREDSAIAVLKYGGATVDVPVSAKCNQMFTAMGPYSRSDV